MEVEAVKQWSRYLRQVCRDFLLRTYALALRVPVITARARIHRAYQHYRTRVGYRSRCARYRYLPVFERLAHYLKRAAVKLRELVKKEQPVVREGYLARLRYAAAACKSRGRYRVVRRAERALCDYRSVGVEKPRYRVYLRRFKRLLECEGRQYRRHPLRKHTLAASRCADKQSD